MIINVKRTNNMADKYELSVSNGEIEVPQEVLKLFEEARRIDAEIKALKAQKDAIEKPLKQAMQKHGVDSFKCEYMTASRVSMSFTETVNTERMKEDGIYEKYMMLIPKAEHVRIAYKKEKAS